MSRIITVNGGQVGQTLAVSIKFDGTDCVPGDKWRLSAPGVTFAPAAAQEIPAGATSHTLTWKSATPLPAGLASPVNVQLIKEHGAGAGPAPVQTIPVTIAPATATPVQVQVAEPIQVQVTGSTPSAARWINGAGIMGWLGGLVILLVVLAFLYVVMYVIAPTAMNGLSSTPAVPAGQSVVVTKVM